MKLFPFRSKIIVLLYHRIALESSDPWGLCVTPDHFIEHLEVLRQFQALPLAQVEPGRFPLYSGSSVVVTFDDGYSDNFRMAAPLLRRYDTPATFFIATGYLGSVGEYWWDELERIVFDSARLPAEFQADLNGRRFSWEIPAGQSRALTYSFLYDLLRPLAEGTRRQLIDRLGELCQGVPEAPGSRRPMTHKEVQVLAEDSLFEIGAHTITHPLLAARPIREQYAEIAGSKEVLETILDRPVTSFSYPYGGKEHFQPETVAAARECGFARACTTEGHAVRRKDGPFEISRLNVTDLDGDAFLKLLLA